jgi:hypothetical protein
MANFYYPTSPPVVDDTDAGLMTLGVGFNTGSGFPTEYIDFLKITCLKVSYDSGAVLSNAGAAGATAIKDKISAGDTVYLYMPNSLSVSYSANYSNIAFGVAGKLAAEGMGKSGANVVAEIQAAAGAAAPEALFNTIAQGANNFGSVLGTGGSIDTNSLSAVTQGKIFNPFEEQIFTGVSFRSHPFSWKLVAKNKKDAENIQAILRFFKYNMLPSFSDGVPAPGSPGGGAAPAAAARPASGATAVPPTNAAAAGATPFGAGSAGRYLSVPNRFSIEMVRVNYAKGSFTTGGDIGASVYKFKQCLLESMNVGYTPDGQYVSTLDTFVPAMQLDLTFKEVSYVTAQDIAEGF